MTSAKYDSLVKSLADLNIGLVDSNNEFRSTYDILSDIAAKWDSLSSMEQAGLAETIAGTRQQAVFFSIIEQFQEASGAMEAMAGSAGTLEESYSTYLDSTTAHINQFNAAFEELSATMFNSDLLSNIVDIGTAFTGLVNTLAKFKLLIPSIAAGAFIPSLVKANAAIIAQDAAIKKLIADIVAKGALDKESIATMSKLTISEQNLVKTEIRRLAWSGQISEATYAQIYNDYGLVTANTELEGSNATLAASFKAVGAAIPVWGWVLLAITGVVAIMGTVVQKSEEMRQAFKDSTDELNNQIDALEEYKKQIKEISESDEDSTKKLEDYNKIRQEIIDGYDTTIQKISEESDAVDILNKKLEDEIENKRKLYLRNNEDNFNKTINQVNDFKQNLSFFDFLKKSLTEDTVSDWRKVYAETSSYFGDTTISENILDLFDSGTGSKMRLGEVFTIGEDAKDELELLQILEDAYLRFGDIKEAREKAGNDLTDAESGLYKALQKQYLLLKENLGEDGINFDTATEYAVQEVEHLVQILPQGNKSLDEWRESLVNASNGNSLIVDQIDKMIDGLRDLNQVIEPNTLESVSSILDNVEGKLEKINEAIKTANDYFEDLAKVIDNNADTDKFFTADEMIDMLDKYPELADNILVTAYGYKFETSALEELRQAKLAEQKTAIETQLAEAKGAKESTEAELATYSAKLNGISTLAEAEIALAEVEDQLNSGKFAQGGYIANQLEEKRANLAGAIDAWKRMSDADQNIEKAEMQYTILGTVFDDLKDSTNDATAALNNQKSALNDLKDEYKDAQDAIEDLIKLTMDMIV